MKLPLLLCALVGLVGCGKKSADAPVAPAAGIETGSGAKATTADEVVSPAEVDRTKQLERLTQALRRFSAEHRRVPKSLDELVAAGYLPELPAPPSGKKFIFDDQLRVTLK